MRTLVSVLFLIVLLAFSANAKTNFGIKGGLDMAKLTGDGWDDAEQGLEAQIDDKMKMGFALGFVIELPMGTGGFSLQPEFLYVMKGGEAEFPEMAAEGYDVTMTLKQDYIEVPVLIKYTVPGEGKMAPCFFAGPYAAFNIGSKVEFEGLPAEAVDDAPDGDIENAKSADFGVTFGGGLNMAVGQKGKLTFDLRYTLGLTNIFDDVAEDEYEDNLIYFTDDNNEGLAFKNSDIRLMVGFFF
jgi:hypothetical protein